ncbi:MAG: HAD hydrolase family protein [Bacteroidetes bacterium]|nr:HAD hydrolase family protein [Bacteroidota bacterium]
MGKPFEKELQKINDTFNWASKVAFPINENEIYNFKKEPALFVGSGGSLSACYFGVWLHQKLGFISKALTPLELLQSKTLIAKSHIIFLSASGRNADILKSCEIAKQFNAKTITSIIMSKNSMLAKSTSTYEISNTFEFNIPTGKDGFLATNSLVAYFTILSRLYGINLNRTAFNHFPNDLEKFIVNLPNEFTLYILYSGPSTPVAYDIESKFSEAALGNVLLADYRNFGHGRHHWFDKKNNTAIIALVTPEIKDLADKTLSILPQKIPIFKLGTTDSSPVAIIDLLIQSFQLVNLAGKKVGIDPGRPGVPSYGSQLYHLSYAGNLLPPKSKVQEEIWMQRKSGFTDTTLFSQDEKSIISKSLNQFKVSLSKAKFGGILFDYDGTLCNLRERFTLPSTEIKKLLNDLLKNGYFIGIVTGRGKSVRTALQKTILSKFHNQVIIGYYNGSQIAFLSENIIPDPMRDASENLKNFSSELLSDSLIKNFIKKNQLVIELKFNMIEVQICKSVLFPLKNYIRDYINLSQNKYPLKFTESGHSIDILETKTSKLDIVPQCQILANRLKVPNSFICIGDMGRWPGNDFELLNSNFSLSVDSCPAGLNTGWNLASPGVRGVSATKEYLGKIKKYKGYFKIKI